MSKNSLRYPDSAIVDGHLGTARIHPDMRSARKPNRGHERKSGVRLGTGSGRLVRGHKSVALVQGKRQPLAISASKPAKYRNQRCEHNGVAFDSLRERSRWVDLLARQARGEIRNLRRQVPFVLAVATVIDGKRSRARQYVADFVYATANGEPMVEDVKGFRTAIYRLKRHLMKTVHGIEIVEVTK